MLELGCVVVASCDGEQRVGQIVAVRSCAAGPLYDVSFERDMKKALLEDELKVASRREVQAMLAWCSLDPELNAILESPQGPMRASLRHIASSAWPEHAQGFLGHDSVLSDSPMPPTTSRSEAGSHAGTHAPSSPAAMRDVLLRQEYAAWLAKAMDSLGQDARSASVAIAQATRHLVGGRVAVHDQGAWCLGTVRRAAQGNGGVTYTVEVLDELCEYAEDEVCALADVPYCEHAHRLGARARMVAEGHESDASFEGVICRVERDEDEMSYALLFDDGDVFEGLVADDLIALG